MSSRHALVMIVYFGHRWERKKENFVPYEDENDVYPMVQYQIESLKKLDPGVDTDIIIVNNSPNSERAKELLDGLNGAPALRGVFRVVNGDNLGGSFGGYNTAYMSFRGQYDYWFFNEDDVIITRDGFYSDAVDQLQDKSVGFVAINGFDYIGTKWGYKVNANHVHGACGCTTAEKLEELISDKGEIPHAHVDGMEDKRRQIAEGELSFTPWFEQQGYRFEMIKGEKPFTRWCHPGGGTIGLDESKWGPGSCTWILQNDDRLK